MPYAAEAHVLEHAMRPIFRTTHYRPSNAFNYWFKWCHISTFQQL